MATEFIFNGRKVILPGAYSTIKSGIKNRPTVSDWGTVLIIDTGLGATFGGGAGIDGELAKGTDAVYQFDNISDYRYFLKGGKFWKLADPLFKPYKTEPGVSKIYHVKAAKTTCAEGAFQPTGGGSGGGDFVFKVKDEGVIGNGVVDGVTDNLEKGYGFSFEPGIEDSSKWVMKFWVGTYKGAYPSDGTFYGEAIGADVIYDEVPPTDTQPLLLVTSVEFNNLATLINWAKTNKLFNTYFILDEESSGVNGSGVVNSTDILNYPDIVACSGGTETYSVAALNTVLETVQDLDYVFILIDKYGVDDYDSTEVGMIISHIQSEAKYMKFAVYGGGYDGLEFYQATDSSRKIAEYFDSDQVIVVHGGCRKSSSASPTGMRNWDSQVHAAYLLGRLCGLEPQVPITNKRIDIDGLVHNLTEKERIQAIRSGLLTTYYDGDFGAFVCLKGTNSLQNNTNLVNSDGTSFNIQMKRIVAQISHDIVINAKVQLLGQPHGVNRNTLSANYVKNWTEAFLETKVATASTDNLILGFTDVSVETREESFWVTYKIYANNEIDKIFFTGFLI